MQTTEAQTAERPNITTRPERLEDRIREACRADGRGSRSPLDRITA